MLPPSAYWPNDGFVRGRQPRYAYEPSLIDRSRFRAANLEPIRNRESEWSHLLSQSLMQYRFVSSARNPRPTRALMLQA